jgi:hypothetical protein
VQHIDETFQGNVLVIERHQVALVGEQLELLARKPALRGINETIGLACIPRDASDRQSRALPDIVVIDLCNRAGDTFRQLRFD